MNNAISKVVYPAELWIDGEHYKVFFPDFDVTGNGLQDLNETVDFASSMLAEIIIDYKARGIDLPKQSQINESNTVISKYIGIDVDDYVRKAKNNRERLFLNFEDYQSAEPIGNKTNKFSLSNVSKMKKYLTIIIAAIVCISLVVVFTNISEKREREEWQAKTEEETALAEEYILQARKDIKKELYKKAEEDINNIYGLETIEEDYKRAERNSLLNYAKLLSARSNGDTIDNQYKLLDQIDFTSNDEFFEEYENLKKTVENEYALSQVTGKIKTSSEERERREQLATRIPYKGMSESDMNSTAAGAYSLKNVGLYYDASSEYDTLYDWDAETSGSATLTLRVGTKDGVVTYVEQNYDLWAWDGDTPLFLERVHNSQKWPRKKDDKYEAYNYLTAAEFADAKQSEFIDASVNELKKQGADPDTYDQYINDYAWIKAFDYWLSTQPNYERNQQEDHDAYMDAVENSEN